jgi:phosphatidylglycerol:prolipoprotein diacylglycerol transferase
MLLSLVFPQIDPVAIAIGPFAIRWYALAYVVGILLGWWVMIRLAALPGKTGEALMPRRAVDDFVVWATLGIVLGGRLGYVLFYDFPVFAEHPLQIFAVWKGGMSFHGGLIGVVTAIWLFARVRRLPFLTVGDLVCAVVPIGLFFGRLANFVNGELWGRPTDEPWGMIFCNEQILRLHDGRCLAGTIPRHPSQLYEATLEGIVLFAVLMLLVRGGALKRPGFVAGAFLTGYGVARIVSEFFRQPDIQLGFLVGGATMGQLLSIPVLLAGLYFIWRARSKS